MSASYAELLQDPRWKRRRLEILRRDERTCQECGATDSLQVHHRWYEFGRRPWEYEDAALVTLCESCHAATTKWTRALKFALRRVQPSDMARIAGYAEGIVAMFEVETVKVVDAHQALGLADSAWVSDREILEQSDEKGGEVNLSRFEIDGADARNERVRTLVSQGLLQGGVR